MLIIGVIVVSSIVALTIVLSMDKIFVNQNNLEIEKEDLELVNIFQQKELSSKTTEELTDSNISINFSNYLDAFSASRSVKMKLKDPGYFDVYFTLKDFNLCKTTCNPCLLYTSPSPRDGLLSRMPSSA